MSDLFTTWKVGVLAGLGAPDNTVTTDVLWAWQAAEGGIGHLNPLNTTYYMAGAVPWNTLSNGSHVWSYLTIGDGINATVVTLLAPDPSVGLPNGYDVIVDHLRRSVPRPQWGDACWQLTKWGTGCGWLNTYYGAAPGDPGEFEMLDPNDPLVQKWAQQIQNCEDSISFDPSVEGAPLKGWILRDLKALKAELDALKAQVAALPTPTVTVPTHITLTGDLHS